MEDQNMVVSDCIVICCCCQCMILQILVFVLLKLPRKAIKKTKQFARKLRTQKKGTKLLQIELRRYGSADSLSTCRTSFRLEIEEFFLNESLGLGCCDDKIERVMEDLSSKGVFGFGSFWGGDDAASTRILRSCFEEEMELDYGVFQCRLIELFGSVNFHERY